MNEDLVQRELITRYLLGELSETEQYQFEKVYFTDPATLRELLAMRDDLIDAFVRGQMDAPQKERFERRLRSSPALLQKVEFAKALLQAVDSVRPVREQTGMSAVNSSRRVGRRLSPTSRLWPTLSAHPWRGLMAGLLIVASAFWFAAQRPERSAPSRAIDQTAFASPPAPPPEPGGELAREPEKISDLPPLLAVRQPGIASGRHSPNVIARSGAPTKLAASVAGFLLTTAVSRTDDDLCELAIPAHTTIVRLRLEIEEHGASHYQAVLQTPQGQKIRVKNNLPLRRLPSSYVVVCDLPSALLENRNYLLRLRPLHAKDAADFSYYFKIVKR